MGAQHTAGPWLVKPQCLDEDSEPLFFSIVVGSEACKNKEVANTGSGDFPTWVERNNARLIAAAPDLLEALQAVFEAMGPDIGGMPGSAIEKARAAIAKATGSAS